MTTTTATTFAYTYGDSVTPVEVPLPNRFTYSKGQQALLDFVAEQGWKLDIYALRNTYGYRFDNLPEERRREFLVQNPFALTKAGQLNGVTGTWKAVLDYKSREYSNYGDAGYTNTLKGAKLTFTADDGALMAFDPALSGYATRTARRDENTEIVLQATSKAGYASNNWVWDAALVGEGYSVRERVQVLLANPEAVVTTAITLMAEDQEREAARRAEKVRIRELQNRPLPAGWDALKQAARNIVAADGMSDTDALLAALKDAVAEVEASA